MKKESLKNNIPPQQVFNILFEFRTFISEDIDDFPTQLSFIPFLGLTIWLDEHDINFPPAFPAEGWFKVESVDYLLKDNVFVVSLSSQEQIVVEEEDE